MDNQSELFKSIKREVQSWSDANKDLLSQFSDVDDGEYKLRVNVKQLISLLSSKYNSPNEQTIKFIYTKLAQLSITHCNINLALICVPKLASIKVALFMKMSLDAKTIVDSKNKLQARKLEALSTLASHLNMDEEAEQLAIQSLKQHSDNDVTVDSFDFVINFYACQNKWNDLLSLINNLEPNFNQFKDLVLARIKLQQVQSIELIDENFVQAANIARSSNYVKQDTLNRLEFKHAVENSRPFRVIRTNNLPDLKNVDDDDDILCDDTYNLINYLICSNKNLKRDKTYLFHTYLSAGLFDEAIQELATSSLNLEAMDLGKGVDFVETICRKNQNDTLERIDPYLKVKTLKALKAFTIENQGNVTLVITLLIYIVSLMLLKLESAKEVDGETADHRPGGRNFATQSSKLHLLEVSFQYLATYLKDFNYKTSDSLFASISFLTSSLKVKLDILDDNDVIKDSFVLVVQSTANKFMIYGQYRSAAKLYSSIDDNTNAARALMRLGDINVVVSFALMVCDVAVNRITVNYLKHLKVSQDTIEDFLNKSSNHQVI